MGPLVDNETPHIGSLRREYIEKKRLKKGDPVKKMWQESDFATDV